MGERKLSKVLGEKFDNEKPRFSLLPKGVLNKVITVLEIGAKKYQENNWQHVKGAKTRYFDALHRHVDAWWSGERNDPETGHHHLAHAVCCAMFLMWFDLEEDRKLAEVMKTFDVEPQIKPETSSESIAAQEVAPAPTTGILGSSGFEGYYKHKRTGRTYEVIGVSNRDASSDGKFVTSAIYVSTVDKAVWTRPLTEFLEKFEKI